MQFHAYNKEIDYDRISKIFNRFFNFIKKQKTNFLLYINGAFININKSINNNYCIFSDYQIKIKEL